MSRNYGPWKVYLGDDGINIVSMRDLGPGSFLVMEEKDFVEMVLDQASWYADPPPLESQRLSEGKKT